MAVAVQLATFALDARDSRAVAVFVDDAGRCFPIWVDDVDAAALARAQSGVANDSSEANVVLAGALLEVCGGHVVSAQIRGAVGGVLRAVVVVNGAWGEVEVPAKASAAATLAMLFGAPILVEEGLLAQIDAQIQEAAARASLGRDVAVDESITQTPAERWNQLLQHLAEKLV